MAKISHINKYDIAEYVGLEEAELTTVEDVATLIETFMMASNNVDSKQISSVVMDNERYYYIVVSDTGSTFDLFSFIRDKFDPELDINCTNVKYLFPLKYSRGVYDDKPDLPIEEENDDDIPTSFLDAEDLGIGEDMVYSLYHSKSMSTIKIDKNSVIIGRSPSKVDFLVRGNSNIGRAHCSLYVDGRGKLMIHDFESVNGTFVNNTKVNSFEDVEVKEGDIILLADEEFRVL